MGFLDSIGESLRAHMDERVRSPFAGAFFAAWLAVNWKPVLILTLSEKPIEERVAFVSKNYLAFQDTVWVPLGLAVIFAIVFYSASSLFAVLAESYSSVGSFISKLFDRIRWVAPSAYIEQKRSFQSKIAGLQELASDNLSLVEEEKENTRRIAEELIATQKKLNEAITEIGGKSSEIAALRKNINEWSVRSVSVEELLNSMREIWPLLLGKTTGLSQRMERMLRSGKGADLFHVDKENFILLKNELDEINARILADLNEFDSRRSSAIRKDF